MMSSQRWFVAISFAVLLVVGVPAGGVEPDDPRLTPVVLAYRKARPAVVNISTEKIVRVKFGFFGGDFFEDIFPSPRTRRVPVQSLGSGFVINTAGYIVTNAHVVQRAEKITVTFPDGSEYQARAISSDPNHDLAVLKIEPAAGVKLAHLPLGRSDDLMVGETVIAIGNPLGFANTLTTGVISAIDRTASLRGDVEIRGLIQTDAPINPGNSGGPLLNVKGELIGVNTAIHARAQNIGFAIAVDRLADELVHLLDFERLNRAIFGAVVTQRRVAGQDELYVTNVRKGTPADGKLRIGDRVVALNGEPMRQISDYVCVMVGVEPDSTVKIKCIRNGTERLVEVTMKAKPRPDGKALARRLFGLTLRPVTPELARTYRLTIGRGLLVVGVEANSPANRLGIEVRDVVFQMGRLYATDLDGLGMILEDVQAGQKMQIGIVRGNVRAWAPITARKASSAGANQRERAVDTTDRRRQ